MKSYKTLKNYNVVFLFFARSLLLLLLSKTQPSRLSIRRNKTRGNILSKDSKLDLKLYL